MNNILGANEIADNTMIQDMALIIPVAASNVPQLRTIYNESPSAPMFSKIGQAFCDNNKTSNTGESYRDYYGNNYDN